MKLDYEILAEYVAGGCEPEVRAQIDRLQETDSAVADAIEELRAQKSWIRDSFDELLDLETPASLNKTVGIAQTSDSESSSVRSETVSDKRPKFSGRSIAAGLLLLIAGGVMGFGLQKRAATESSLTWTAAVAEYQALYSRQTLNIADATQEQRIQTASYLEGLSGLEVAIPDLDDFELAFKRGQYLEVKGQPLIQLAYLPESGGPVALCFKAQAGEDVAPVQGRHAGLEMQHWRANGVAFVLVGSDRDQVRSVSEHLFRTRSL